MNDSESIRQRTLAVYDRHAEAWDRHRPYVMFEREWLDRFIARLPPGGRILDAGCGALLMTIGHEAGEVQGVVEGEAVYHASLAPEEYVGRLRTLGFGHFELTLEDPRRDGRRPLAENLARQCSRCRASSNRRTRAARASRAASRYTFFWSSRITASWSSRFLISSLASR